MNREDKVRPELIIPLSALPGLVPNGLMVSFEDQPGVSMRVLGSTDRIVRVPLGMDGHVQYPREGISVDLTHDCNVDAVARWLAKRVDIRVHCTAPGWRPTSQGIWVLASFGKAAVWVARESHSRGQRWVVPALAELDIYSWEELPDGSPVVHRHALALVAAHEGRQAPVSMIPALVSP